MQEKFDKRKMLETLMNPDVSVIIAELEDGEKSMTYITEKLQLSNSEIMERLKYVVEHGFVIIIKDDDEIKFSVDKNKLDEIMTTDENFSGVVDGLTELDQYLN